METQGARAAKPHVTEPTGSCEQAGRMGVGAVGEILGQGLSCAYG